MAEKQDEFEAAFAEFAAPEDKKPADAATAGADGGGDASAASGGENVTGSDGGADAGAAASGSAGDAGDPGANAVDGAAAGQAAGDAGAAGETDGAAPDAQGGDAGASGAEAGAAAAAGAADDQAGAQKGDAGTPAVADPDAILDGLRKLVGDVKQEPEKKPEAATQELPELYNDEEKAFLTKYDEDWSDVTKGEALKRRAEYRELATYIFSEVAKFMTPLRETTDALAERTFRADVKSAVPDYSDDLRQSVIDWTKTQPAYLQAAFNQVITEGTVDEVKDLIERYRQATGKAAPAAGGQKPARGNELSDEAKKAAAQLAPVDSKRSGVQAPSDPSSFEDAWKQATAELG